MTRYLFCSVPAAGHVNPGLPVARALVHRGHEVHWYTGRAYRAAVEATGAVFEPMRHAIDAEDDVGSLARAWTSANLEGLPGLRFDMKHLFLDVPRNQIADLDRILRTYPADVIVADTGFLAASLLHELGGPIFATYGIIAITLKTPDTAPFGLGLAPGRTPLHRLRNRALQAVFDRVLFRDVQRHHQHVRAGVGLAPTRSTIFDSFSPYLYLQSSTPAFEYPRRDLPPHGVDLRTKAPTEQQLADAVRTVLDDDRYRRNAERIRDDFRRHDGPAEAAALLEELAGTRRPITRRTAVERPLPENGGLEAAAA